VTQAESFIFIFYIYLYFTDLYFLSFALESLSSLPALCVFHASIKLSVFGFAFGNYGTL